MSNVTIVAVTNSFNDTVTMLPPSANIENVGQVLFHNNPRLEFDGADISANFDHHIDFRITKNKLHQELLGEAYTHYPRLKRRTQYLNVFQFNKGRPVDQQITIPHYYMATLREGEHVGITNFGIPKCDKVVIKEQLGARGSNQVVVPTNMLTTLLKHSKGKTLGEVSEMFPDLIYTDNSNWEMKFFDDPNDLFISELLTNVKSEYRLLVGGDRIYGRERTIKAGPYPQANLEVDKFHSVQEVTYERIEDMFDEALVKTLYDFVAYIDLPIGSVDLYSTTDGTWGIFEYSTQFAFHGASPTFIRQLLLDSVEQILTRNADRLPTEPTMSPTDVYSDDDIVTATYNILATKKETRPAVINVHSGPMLSHATRMKLDAVIGKYNTLISTINAARLNVDSITRPLLSKGVYQVDVSNLRNNQWSFRLHANSMSLDINHQSPWTEVLPKQGFVLSEWVKLVENELDPHAHETVAKQTLDVRKAINDLVNSYSDRPSVKYTLNDYIGYLLNKIVLTHSTMMYYLGDNKVNTPSTHYDAIYGEEFVSYIIHSDEPDLTINLNKKDNISELSVNDGIPFFTWITNRSKDKPKTTADKVNNVYNDLSALVDKLNDIYQLEDSELETNETIISLNKDLGNIG